MNFKVGVGKSDFEDLRQAGNYYVDKTELLYELVEETDNKVTLFTRPRRFGKTLMMSMMENFFSVRKDSRDLFKGLAITEHQTFCEAWMNQYPVLFISFKDIEGETFDSAYKMLRSTLADLCKDLASALDGETADRDDERIFLNLKAKNAAEDDVKSSLRTIMRMMHAVCIRKKTTTFKMYMFPALQIR